MRRYTLWVFSWLLLAGCANQAAPDATAGPETGGLTGASGGSGGTSLGLGGNGGAAKKDSGSGGQAGACASATLEASVIKRPLDLVIYVDWSSSMGNAVNAIKSSFDQSFSNSMVQSGIDYRVIMIAPKSFVTNPADPSRYFLYPRGTGSSDLPMAFLTTFDQPPAGGVEPKLGWSQWARPNASRALVAITDAKSGPSKSASYFETELYDVLKLPGFGTEQARNYRFHFIAGFVGNTPAGTPWLPSDPVVGSAKCAGTGKSGQDLAILSSGLRFSMCDYTSYSQMFDALAQAEASIVPIACEFSIPTPPDGKTIDPNTIEIVYGTTTIHQVHDASECASGGFYVSGAQIELCDATCTTIQADSGAKLDVSYGCPTGFVPK